MPIPLLLCTSFFFCVLHTHYWPPLYFFLLCSLLTPSLNGTHPSVQVFLWAPSNRPHLSLVPTSSMLIAQYCPPSKAFMHAVLANLYWECPPCLPDPALPPSSSMELFPPSNNSHCFHCRVTQCTFWWWGAWNQLARLTGQFVMNMLEMIIVQ